VTPVYTRSGWYMHVPRSSWVLRQAFLCQTVSPHRPSSAGWVSQLRGVIEGLEGRIEARVRPGGDQFEITDGVGPCGIGSLLPGSVFTNGFSPVYEHHLHKLQKQAWPQLLMSPQGADFLSTEVLERPVFPILSF